MIVEPAINRIALVGLAVWSGFVATATASSDVVTATSPDKKFTVKLGDCNDFGCKAELKATGNQETLASTDIEAFDPGDAHRRISAHWRDDSAAVALNIDNGRSITDCVVFLLFSLTANGGALSSRSLTCRKCGTPIMRKAGRVWNT